MDNKINLNEIPRWISTKDKLPEFDKSVLVWCSIYGMFIASYECIGEFGTAKYGNWRYGNELGILPPLYWMELPLPPSI